MPTFANLRFQQIHIDAARNATDDFNPFHDPGKFPRIRGNPYAGSIALGFQLECLCAYLVDRQQETGWEEDFIAEHGLGFTHHQFTFASALVCDQDFMVDIKPTLTRADPPGLSTRILVRRGEHVVLLGNRREVREPLVPADPALAGLRDLRDAPDRAPLAGTGYFLKRKYLNTGNAKNFLAGSLADQAYYFDELAERVRFPQMFPCALLSCALLERARWAGHAFMTNPMVYASHHISVDRQLARQLHSNDVLHMLVSDPEPADPTRGLVGHEREALLYRCYGYLGDGQLLYRARILLIPLAAILASQEPGEQARAPASDRLA